MFEGFHELIYFVLTDLFAVYDWLFLGANREGRGGERGFQGVKVGLDLVYDTQFWLDVAYYVFYCFKHASFRL